MLPAGPGRSRTAGGGLSAGGLGGCRTAPALMGVRPALLALLTDRRGVEVTGPAGRRGGTAANTGSGSGSGERAASSREPGREPRRWGGGSSASVRAPLGG